MRAPAACASGNGQFNTVSATNEMDEQPGAADHGEHQEAQRHHVVGEFRQHQPEEIQRHHGVELALAMQPRAEGEGNLDRLQLAMCGRDEARPDGEPDEAGLHADAQPLAMATDGVP